MAQHLTVLVDNMRTICKYKCVKCSKDFQQFFFSCMLLISEGRNFRKISEVCQITVVNSFTTWGTYVAALWPVIKVSCSNLT